MSGVDVRRADERFVTKLAWLDSRHSFSFGPHYDPRNTHHGLLLVNNDDVVSPGGGFETHPHRDMEIVTWVLEAALAHEDSTGQRGVLYPGVTQAMSAGTGVLHSETNASARPVHFVQMWVVPDESGREPSYDQLDIGDQLRNGELVPVASGRRRYDADAAIRIANRHAALHAARLAPGQAVTLPDAPFLHLFLAAGAAQLEGVGRLDAGDAVRFTATGGQRVTAEQPSELLVWEMHSALTRR